MRLTAMVLLIGVLAACGRKGPLERTPGEPVPIAEPYSIETGDTEPTKPRSTLF